MICIDATMPFKWVLMHVIFCLVHMGSTDDGKYLGLKVLSAISDRGYLRWCPVELNACQRVVAWAQAQVMMHNARMVVTVEGARTRVVYSWQAIIRLRNCLHISKDVTSLSVSQKHL